MNQIGVIGAGNWGTTLAKVLGENNQQTLLWSYREEVAREINETHINEKYLPGSRLADCVKATSDLQEVCERCALILLVVPSHVLRGVVNQMGDHLNGEQIIVHCTKGIEQETFKRMSQVIREETCVRKVGVLSGPNLAKELAACQPTGTLVASKYPEVVRRSQEALHNDYFRVYGGRDVIGAEVGGAFKNIVALAAGIADGMGLGDNTKALLLTRGLNEMTRYGTVLGADVLTFGGMAGIGDLMATCASPHSRNHQVGERLAGGETVEQIRESMFMVAEGVKTTASIQSFCRYKGLDLPIVEAVHSVLYEGKSAPEGLSTLMARGVDAEFASLKV